jgi:hypothetical protein
MRLVLPVEDIADRVARAIWEVRHPNPPGWAAWGDYSGFGPSRHERETTLQEARAAMAALGIINGQPAI